MKPDNTPNSKRIEKCMQCKDRFCAVSSLTEDQLADLHDNFREVELRSGEHISHQGSLTSHIVYLRKGLVMEYKKLENGHDQIVQIIKGRTYLGLHSLFGDRENNYSYKALEDVKVCFIDINTFKGLVKTNGDFGYEILVSLSKDSLNSHHRFLNINAKQTFGKVADVLLYFANVIYNSNHFELPLKRNELGSLIGITRESTTRALIKFQNEGI
ncbi:MAG: Crp/Fnr family transcriptional regulator, partial [Bacteroidales bacterium]|nr:Crp/Fnr family transcriptional regulator [Bacteroidales bacterium]